MSIARIALANIAYPPTPDESVLYAREAISQAAKTQTAIICFPEVYVPGYRTAGRNVQPPDAVFLQRA